MRPMLLFALLALAPVALAGKKDEEAIIPVERLQPAQFDAFAASLRGEMDPPGRFQWVTPEERTKVLKALDEMGRILEGHESISELRETDKVALLNAQEVANAILTKRRGDQANASDRAIAVNMTPILQRLGRVSR